MPSPQAAAARKQLGAWYTPPQLIDVAVGGVLGDPVPVGDGRLRVLDPACGDGRFLTVLGRQLRASGREVELVGCDVDRRALAAVSDPYLTLRHVDALTHDWGGERFDVVIGNPPFLSQMAAATSRRGSSRHGGGPYADAAAEFLSLAIRLARPDGGRVALVLPQSILAARDAAPVRAAVDRSARLTWSWWEPRQRLFDAAVNVCVLGFERPGATTGNPPWTAVVCDRLGIPAIPPSALRTNGTLGDRAELNANFRDEYYALVPAVSDHASGPKLITSGLIDPGVCRWGSVPVTFARRRHAAPRVDLSRLSGRFARWAQRKLVPKVLVANQTRVIEAVADPHGKWLPGVPVSTVTPGHPDLVWEAAAVLTAPVASALAWHHCAGTGLSTKTVRIGPASLAAVPWPSGDLGAAVRALQAGHLEECAAAVCRAYGLGDGDREPLLAWWAAQLP